MEDIRVTDKLARALKAFRGRDAFGKNTCTTLLRLRDLFVFPAQSAKDAEEFERMRGKEWFVPGDAVAGTDEIQQLQVKIAMLEAKLYGQQKKLDAARRKVRAKLLSRHRSRVVLIFDRDSGHPLTRAELEGMLAPGHEIVHMGLRCKDNFGERNIYVAVLDIPGSRDKAVDRAYMRGRWDRNLYASNVLDLEKTGYGEGEFADHVQEVIR